MNIKQAILMEEMPDRSSFSVAGLRIFNWCMIALVAVLFTSCAQMQTQTATAPAADQEISPVEVVTGEPKEAVSRESVMSASETGQAQALPVRFQQPTYFINQMSDGGVDQDIVVPVGADISTTSGPVSLRDILKRLAALKNMNVSWASDVDQYVMTDVDIRAGDDFFQAIDNLLRQVDYFHEVEGNTIIVKYKETKKIHIAMPPRLVSVASSNNPNSSSNTTLSADATGNRWDDIRKNLDQILDIWSDTPGAMAVSPAPDGASAGSTETPAAPAATVATTSPRSSKGYYSINEDIGLITVTAPRRLVEKISGYIESLKAEVYRQISIEAKIVEVSLEDSSTSGLNWNDLLNDMNIAVQLFDGTGIVYPHNNSKIISEISIPASFNLVLDAISEQGETKVLANPKVSVMNGQPAVIYIGDNITYIDKVETTIDEGVVTTSVTTAQATSGIRLEVYPTIINDNEIILSLTPMVSGLNKDIEYRSFGGGNEVGLPEIRERTMNSIVRISNGQMLVVGGLIDRTDDVSDTKVDLLGDLPVINKLFKSSQKTLRSKELVILLRPQII
jgi:general secretion pathway protein D/MSHA biogenesis protein MshL